jgi:hypothetical protein
MLRKGNLKVGGSVEFLNDPVQRAAWFKQFEATDWNVFIQGPPRGKSDPAQVVKYLAGYLTGGPISSSRLISADEDEVHFWARPKRSPGQSKRNGMHKPRPYRLSGHQFMQRWSLHILPKGFTRSRCYGGYHGSKRRAYLERCKQLLGLSDQIDDNNTAASESTETSDRESHRKCPHCDAPLILIHSERRPSWREIFEREIYRQNIYSPQHHIGIGRSPPAATLSP